MQHPPKKKIKKQKKRGLILLTLIVLALALTFVLLLPVIRKAFPAQPLDYEMVQSTVRMLDTREISEIDTITIYPDGVSSYTLHMHNGTLMLERGGSLIAIAEAFQNEILETVTKISVQNTVTENAAELADELAAMGLDHPQCRAVVRYQDGSEENMEVGAQVYDSVEYYFRWSGAEGIYICHSGVLETLSASENLLIPFEQAAIYGNLVESLRITNESGECAAAFDSAAAGYLTAPCRYPLTDEAVQTLMTALNSFRLGAYEAPLTNENSAAYGFDDPLCVLEITQREGMVNAIDENGGLTTAEVPAQTLRFVIGRAESDFFYTCAYQDDVYLISRFLVETLVQADWQRMISRTPAAMGDELLSHIVFETPEQTAEVAIDRAESVLANNELEMDANGNIVYLTTVTINGKEAPQEMLEELLDRLNSFTAEGDIPQGTVTEKEPRWRITLVTETGSVRVLEGFRLDAFSDAVAVDGTMRHYVYDEAIDVLMAGLV